MRTFRTPCRIKAPLYDGIGAYPMVSASQEDANFHIGWS
jgi:hypothetical protein